jgi:hypothetical protein
MNTQAEIEQTIEDFRNEKNGFEGTKSWKSSISRLNDDPTFQPGF